jgi:DNA-binding transcriptional regulator GbsR (MarR family)
MPASPSRDALPADDPLTPISRRFVMHWGEMGSRWGVNRTVSQIHALLFVSGRPMPAEEIAEILVVARSNVSNSLKELLSYKLVTVTHRIGDRRDHYETTKDVWDLFRTIVRERKLREFDPTVRVLEACVADPGFGDEDPVVRARISETLAFVSSLSSWSEQMLKLEPATLKKILKLGDRIQKLLGDGRAKPA